MPDDCCMARHANATPPWKCDCKCHYPPRAQDRQHLEMVRSLMGTARMALEEAEQYAEDIVDGDLRRQAIEELEDL